MPRIKRKIIKKMICLGLSAALICESIVPAFGQEFFKNPQGKLEGFFDTPLPEMVSEGTNPGISRAEIRTFILEDARETYKKNMKDQNFARAEEIKKEILGDEQGKLQKEHFGLEEKSNTKEIDYKAEFLKDLNQSYADAKKEISAVHQANRSKIEEAKRNALLNGSMKDVSLMDAELEKEDNIYKETLHEAEKYFNESMAEITNHYDEFLEELKQEAEEAFFEHIKELFAELITIYKNDPIHAKDQILEVTPAAVSVVNGKGERLYNKEQKEILINLYRQVLEEESAKLGNDKDFRTNPCEISGYCVNLTNAMIGLGILSESYKDGDLIMNTIKNYENTGANTTVMLSGIAALLAMKDYELIERFLKQKTEEENESDSWSDYLNFMKWPLAIANTNGKYLGKVSEKAEYSDGTNFRNAYADLAQMLAEDGSPKALDILRKYGINKCYVKKTSSVQKETLAKYSVSCHGIKPFLVGSLLSGKSGAGKYNSPRPVQSKQYLGSGGKLHNSSIERYEELKNLAETAESNYYTFAKEVFNGDAEAMLALHIMSEGMGDLNDVDEYNLDTSLYKVFKKRIPQKFLGAKLIVVDDERLSKKRTRRTVTGAFTGLGLAVDIYLTVSFVLGIGKAAIKLAGFGKNLYSAVNMAKIGLTVKNIPALAKAATKYTKTVIMRQKFVAKIGKISNKFKDFVKNYKEAVRLNILQNAGNYTNAIHEQAVVSLNIARMGTAFTPQMIGAAKQITYSENLGAFVVETGSASPDFVEAIKGIKFNEKLGIFTLRESAGVQIPDRIAEAVNNILDTATVNAKTSYRVSKLFNKTADFGKIFLQEVNRLIAASPLALEEKQALDTFLNSSKFNKALKAADKYVKSAGRHSARDFAKNPLTLKTFSEGKNGGKGSPLGIELEIGEKPPFSDHVPQYAVIAEKNGKFMLNVEGVDWSKSFKLSFESTDGLVDFARASVDLGKAGKIELKFIPKEANNFWSRNFRNVFVRNKEGLFGGRGKVFILGKDGKTLTETPITLKTYKQYDGLSILIKENEGGRMYLHKGLSPLNVSPEGALFIPKYQIGNFLEYAKKSDLKAPWKIKLTGGKNKISSLYWQALISLGVASTSLGGPLRKNFPNMKDNDITMITLALPFAFSIFAPFVSPFIKRFGAVNMLKTSMVLSTGALALPMVMGFNGFGGIQPDNPFGNPNPRRLYYSATLVGLASALMRGSASPLVQAVGGGSGAMKMKAFKSISSFMLLIPPAASVWFDRLNPIYFKNADGSLYLNENGEPVQKHWFDFSFSYPVMLAISAIALHQVQKAHFDVNIGRVSTGGFTNIKQYFSDVWHSYGILFRKDMYPLTLGSLLLSGAESSLLYSYSNHVANEYIGNRIKNEDYSSIIPILALVALNTPAFVSRMNSKSVLKAFGGDNLLGYRHTITTGLALAGTGSYLLAKQDDPVSFGTALLLTSLGFSQLTASILRYGHHKLGVQLKASKDIVTGWDSSYAIINFGMALPKIQGLLVDKEVKGLDIEDRYRGSLKNSLMQDMIALPIGFLVAGGGLTYLGMGPHKALSLNNGKGLVSLLGLTAESHNPILTMPLRQPPFIQENAKPVDLKVNTDFTKLDNLKFTPNFKIQPLREE